ncbi:MAG: HD-GYP domain-containing protein [Pseudothermotoga sp.]
MKLINEAFNLEEDAERFLKKAFDVILDMFPNVDLANISLFDGKVWKVVEAKGFNKDLINALKIPSDQLYTPSEPVLVKEIREFDRQRMISEIFEKIEHIIPRPANTMILPMKVTDQIIGGIVLETTEAQQHFSEHELTAANAIAKIVTSFFVVRRFVTLQEKMSREIVSMLVKALEYYDRYTQVHSQRVAELSKKMAGKLGLSASELELAALLHDVGKIYIPQGILNKEGHLTNDEFDLVKKHPVKGYELINSIGGMEKIARIILYHHERYDGKGYPMGLKNGEIPIESQVIFIADSFDAMTTPRPYRKTPMSFEDAINELKRCAGTQFNPLVVEVLVGIINDELSRRE